MRHERAYPILTCPAGSAPAGTGRGSWTQTEPGLRTAGVGTLSALARDGTSRNRAVWYWTATFPFPVRHGEPAAAAQEDIGQSLASTRWESSSLTPEAFHVYGSDAWLFAPTHETEFALYQLGRALCFIGEAL